MNTVIFIILLFIVAVVLWLFMQPSRYEVVRRRVIAAKPDALYPLVANLDEWPKWNPWFMHEPSATWENEAVSDKSDSWYTWQGQYIGKGRTTQTLLTPNELIEQDVHIVKPIKSKSQVYWRFNDMGDHTEVTWGIRGKMPFLFRWMTSFIDGVIGKEYEIGLARLAMQAGDMTGPFNIEFLGNVEVKAQHYISTHFSGSFDNMLQQMPNAFLEVKQAVKENGMVISGEPFTLYHKFNKAEKQVICDMAVPVKKIKNIEDFNSGTLLGQTYTRTILKGSHIHLENTWHSAFSHARMCQSKLMMNKPLVERYLSDANHAANSETVTYLDLPTKES